ncbi:hypothetical protein [Bradyrhizobium prioriisuperbiae]|uniref:hypothetical protein n=1 Tax=Bradyrhizobium prioriisuperbiae TaxID=2854389 RepID=UPI0028EB7A77|nr:hypothetical protein [Bradyrhizobium prioritasuperba]
MTQQDAQPDFLKAVSAKRLSLESVSQRLFANNDRDGALREAASRHAVLRAGAERDARADPAASASITARACS